MWLTANTSKAKHSPLQFLFFTACNALIKCQGAKSLFPASIASSEWEVRVATARQAALTWMDERPGHSL